MSNSDFYYKLSHNELNVDYRAHVILIKYLRSYGIIFINIANQLIRKMVKNNQLTELRDFNYNNELRKIIKKINLLPELINANSVGMFDYLNSIGYLIETQSMKLQAALYYILNFDRSMDGDILEELDNQAAIRLIKEKYFDSFKYLYHLMSIRKIWDYYATIVYTAIISENLSIIELVLSKPLLPHGVNYHNIIESAEYAGGRDIIKLVKQYQPASAQIFMDLKKALLWGDDDKIKNIMNIISDLSVYVDIVDEFVGLYDKTYLMRFIRYLSVDLLSEILITILTKGKVNKFKVIFDNVLITIKPQLIQQILDQIYKSSIALQYRRILDDYNEDLIRLINRDQRTEHIRLNF